MDSPARRSTRLAAGVLALAACSSSTDDVALPRVPSTTTSTTEVADDEWQQQTASLYTLVGQRLSVPAACHRQSRLTLIEESPASVTILLEVRGEIRGDCRSCPEAQLASPLGERDVIDERTQRVIDPGEIC